jgi:hypothetical protein
MEGASPISRWYGIPYAYTDLATNAVSFLLPPGARVMRVAHEVTSAFTGATDATIGDGDDPDGWCRLTVSSGVDFTAVGMFMDPGAALSLIGKLYADGDTIDIALTGTITAGAGILWVEVISYNEAAGAE